MSTHQPWAPIEDLPRNWNEFASRDLKRERRIWEIERQRLKDTKALQEFHRRLVVEWAVETGILENLYDLDRGTTTLLTQKGIREDLISGNGGMPAAQIASMLTDHEQTVEGVRDFIDDGRTLSVSYIKSLHQSITRHQETTIGLDSLGTRVNRPLRRGEFKNLPNNPTRPDGSVYEYCPPEQTVSEMERLVDMHLAHNEMDVPPEVEAAWLHHRFSQIHPFQDGNGRVARTLASLVLMRAYLWPLIIDRDQKEAYTYCLEQADSGSLRPLVDLFASFEVRKLEKSNNLSDDIVSSDSRALDALTKRLKRKQSALTGSSDFQNLMNRVQELASIELTKFSEKPSSQGFSCQIIEDRPFYSGHIADLPAERLDQLELFNCHAFRATSAFFSYELDMGRGASAHESAELFFMLAPIGRADHGKIAGFLGVAFPRLTVGDPADHEEDNLNWNNPLRPDEVEILPASREVFRIQINEDEKLFHAEFSRWIHDSGNVALAEWYRRIDDTPQRPRGRAPLPPNKLDGSA